MGNFFCCIQQRKSKNQSDGIQQAESQQQLQEVDYFQYQPFEFKMKQKNNIGQFEICLAIAFDQDASLIFYGCNEFIKINKFEKGNILDEIQILNGHTKNVNCLSYMKYSKKLASASEDCSIIIWNRNESGKWIIRQKLEEHKFEILSLILNSKEDLLISGSGSDDKTIKFWERENSRFACQQTIQTKFWVSGLSLDNESNKLLACGYKEPGILVISKTQNKDWKIIQIMSVEYYGLRLSFIDSNMFAFQPNDCELLEIYEFDMNLNEFTKTTDLVINNSQGSSMLSPGQYIQSKQILFIKHNEYLNIITKLDNGQFIIQQSINFETERFIGRVTEDGEYLVTCNNEELTLETRKFEYLK